MSAPITIVIPGMHSWQRPRAHQVGGKLVFFTDKATREFVDLVAVKAREAIKHPLQGYYAVKVVGYTANFRSRDFDRVLNGVMDGLVKSGRVRDDRYAWKMSVERRLTDGQERIEVELMEYEPRREGALV